MFNFLRNQTQEPISCDTKGSLGIHSIMQTKKSFLKKNRVVNGLDSVERTNQMRTEKYPLTIADNMAAFVGIGRDSIYYL